MVGILTILTIIVSLIAGLLAVAITIGAQAYAVQQAKLRQDLLRRPYAKAYRRRPLVSVLLYAHNDAGCIEQCLDAVFKSTYRKLEVVVVDNGSDDHIKDLVKLYQARHPKRAIKILAKRSATSNITALKQGYRTYGNGELVVWCTADMQLEKTALKRMVEQMALRPELNSAGFNHQTVTNLSVVGLLQKYNDLLHAQSQKSKSWAGLLSLTESEAAIWTKASFLAWDSRMVRQRNAGSLQLSGYESQAIVRTMAPVSIDSLLQRSYRQQRAALGAFRTLADLPSPVVNNKQLYVAHTLARLWLLLQGILVIGTPIAICFVLYLALSLHEADFFGLGLAAFSVYLVLAICASEQWGIVGKMRYILGVPLSFSVFGLIFVVQQPYAFMRNLFTP